MGDYNASDCEAFVTKGNFAIRNVVSTRQLGDKGFLARVQKE